MIKVEKIDKFYNKGKSNEIHVINETSLALPEKGLIALLGPSGSGKTTLLNVIGGLDKANGKIYFDQEEISRSKMDKFRRANIGYVFQNYHLLPDLSVLENLRLSLEEVGVFDLKEIDGRIEYVLAALKLDKYKHRNVQALSGGQQQRVSIARALIKDAKIIIADEPTGNLDSENSIEVMNILKKISQTRLVLLVTHNAVLADFYSDRIIQLRDGSILSDTENNDIEKTLDTRNNSVIYLGDLNKTSVVKDNLAVDVYKGNEESSEPIHLKIIEQNGTFYIDLPSHLKVIDRTNIKLVEEKYQDLTSDSFEEYEFEMSAIPESARKRKPSFKKLWKQIVQIFHNFYNVRFRTKILYFGFVCIGAVMAISMIFLGTFDYVNMEGQTYLEDYYTVEIDSSNYHRDIVKATDFYTKANELGYIENIVGQRLGPKAVGFSNYYSNPFIISSENEIQGKYLYGRAIENENEVVITKIVADLIVNAYKSIGSIGYRDLLDAPVTIAFDGNYTKYGNTDEKFRCVGIVSDKSETCYVSNIIISDYTVAKLDYSYNPNLDKFYHKRLIDDGIITLMAGEAPREENDYLEALVPFFINKVGETIDINGTIYTISGQYYSDVLNGALLEPNTEISTYISTSSIGIASDNLYLVEGRLPLNPKEIVVPYGYETKYNSNNGYKVVGKHIEPKSSNTYGSSLQDVVYMTKTDYLDTLISNMDNNYSYYNYVDYFIKINNLEKMEQLAQDFGVSFVQSYDAIFNSLQKDMQTGKLVFFSISLALLLIIIVYVFFMMRSKMIARIYEIGVLRSIGASKSRILRSFLVESIVISTLTSLLGYLLVTIGFLVLNSKVSQFINFFNLSTLYLVSGILILYAVNIIFGLLPIFLLLRKTPAEILSKYDI